MGQLSLHDDDFLLCENQVLELGKVGILFDCGPGAQRSHCLKRTNRSHLPEKDVNCHLQVKYEVGRAY